MNGGEYWGCHPHPEVPAELLPRHSWATLTPAKTEASAHTYWFKYTLRIRQPDGLDCSTARSTSTRGASIGCRRDSPVFICGGPQAHLGQPGKLGLQGGDGGGGGLGAWRQRGNRGRRRGR